MLNGNEIVFELFGFVFGLRQQAIQTRRDVNLLGPAAAMGDLGHALQLLLDAPFKAVSSDAGLGENRNRQAILLVEQRCQQMLDVNLLMAVTGSFVCAALSAS